MTEKRIVERRSIINRRAERTDRRVIDVIGYLTEEQGKRGNDSDRRHHERRFLHRRIKDWVNRNFV